MSDNLTISTESPTILSCPACNETIDVSSQACRFCGAPINADFARHAAEVMARVNQACSDASYMRSTALALPVFLVLRFLPILNSLGEFGWTILIVLLPIWAVRWWLRFADLESADPDYTRARKSVKIVGFTVGAIAALTLVLLTAVFAMSFVAALARHR